LFRLGTGTHLFVKVGCLFESLRIKGQSGGLKAEPPKAIGSVGTKPPPFGELFRLFFNIMHFDKHILIQIFVQNHKFVSFFVN